MVVPCKPKTVSEIARVSAWENRVGASDGGRRARGGLLAGCPDVWVVELSVCPDMMVCNNTVADAAKQKTRKKCDVLVCCATQRWMSLVDEEERNCLCDEKGDSKSRRAIEG